MAESIPPSRSEYLAFLDESGDHSLEKIDPGFPIFVLSLVLIKRQTYETTILNELNRLKLRYWDHEGVNLHSRDIRKKQAAFSVLVTQGTYNNFVEDLSELMQTLNYELFTVVIDKTKLKNKYKHADNPYDLSLKYLLERVVHCMGVRSTQTLPMIAESRGKNEDNQLKAVFFDIVTKGTEFRREEFQKLQFSIEFQDKKKNIGGIQLADLCAYPCARYVLNPTDQNKPFEIVRKHIYLPQRDASIGFGWKHFS